MGRASLLGSQVDKLAHSGQAPPGACLQLLLETAALGIAGLQDPAPGRGQFRHLASHVGLQPRVRQGDPGRLGHRVGKFRVVQYGGVMDKRRDLLAVLPDYRDRLSRPGFGQLDEVPALVGVSIRFGQPVPDRQRPVAQGMGEPGPERACFEVPAQIDDQPCDGRLTPSPQQQVREEPDSDKDQDCLIAPQHRLLGTRSGPGQPCGASACQRYRQGGRRDHRHGAGTAVRARRPQIPPRGHCWHRADDSDRHYVAAGQREYRRAHVGGNHHDHAQPARGPPAGVADDRVAQRATMQEQQRRPNRGDRRDARAGKRPQKPGEPGQGKQGADAALRTARPDQQPAPDQCPPHRQVGHSRGQALGRTSQPFRPQAHDQGRWPRCLSQPRSESLDVLTRRARKAHAPTAHSWR
jgi:hypothetical protein